MTIEEIENVRHTVLLQHAAEAKQTGVWNPMVGYKDSDAKVPLETWYFEELCLAEDQWKCDALLLLRFIESLKTKPEFAYTGPFTWAEIFKDSLPLLERLELFGMPAAVIGGCKVCMNALANEGEVYFFPGFNTLKNIKHPTL